MTVTCTVPGGSMYSHAYKPEETLRMKRKRLRAVLMEEISHTEYNNAWVTLSWLTLSEFYMFPKVRLPKVDAAVLLLETNQRTQADFHIDWNRVICG